MEANRRLTSGPFFLVPGMAHCGGGPSLDRIDMLSAVVDWMRKEPRRSQ